MAHTSLPSVKTKLFYMLTADSKTRDEVLTLVQQPLLTDLSSESLASRDPDETFRGTTTEVGNLSSVNLQSEASTTIEESEYRLEMRPIQVKDSASQIWFYRYDCIVNQAHPSIALSRSETAKLVPRHFNGTESQLLKPVLILAATDTYVLEANDSTEALSSTCNEDGKLHFEQINSNDHSAAQWHLAGPQSGMVQGMLDAVKRKRAQSRSIVTNRKWQKKNSLEDAFSSLLSQKSQVSLSQDKVTNLVLYEESSDSEDDGNALEEPKSSIKIKKTKSIMVKLSREDIETFQTAINCSGYVPQQPRSEPTTSKNAEESKGVSSLDERISIIDRATTYFKKTFKARDESIRETSTPFASLLRGTSMRRNLKQTFAEPIEEFPEQARRHTMIISEEVEQLTVDALEKICNDETSLDDYSKLSVFKTLFSKEGVPRDLKAKFWLKLANIPTSSPEERAMQEQMFTDMANKPNAELDEQLRNDESEMRYPIMRQQEPLELIQPDKAKMVKVIRAYNNSDPMVTLKNQGYVYIISGLLEYLDQCEFLAYHFLIKLMFDFNWRNHYLVENDENYNPKVGEFHARIAEIAPSLYQLVEDDGWGKTGIVDVWQNMYSYTVFSMCFGAHIPACASARILEWILFMENEDHSLVILLVYMLKVAEQKIIGLENGMERFQYISQGKFIVECLQTEELFDDLVSNYLTLHVNNVFQTERQVDEMEFNNLEQFDQRRQFTIEDKVRHGLMVSNETGSTMAESTTRDTVM